MTSICEVRSFAERDIDVLLAEELRVNPEFARWFADCSGLPKSVDTPASCVRISVVSENGETDVEAQFTTPSGNRIALLVENKIAHSLSLDQLRRYQERGHHGQAYGYWDAFYVTVFAPGAKLLKNASLLQGISHISFEDAALFLRANGSDRRTIYRSEFLARAAVEQKLDAEGADAFRIAFWKHVYALVEERYPGFFDLDVNTFPKTTYIAANCSGAPGYFRLDLKGHMGEVSLAFNNVNPGALLAYLEANKPQESTIAFNKKSIALQITGLPKFLVSDGLEALESKALQSFEAAHNLLTFWARNRSFFDSHYSV